jgi:F-type H+-transporting ATPase subunit b
MDTLIDWGSFAIQAINFAIVAFILRRFFFVPYSKYLDEETKKRHTLEAEIAKSANILSDAHAQAANIVDQAKVDARLVGTEIIENARKEWSELLARAHTDADSARSKWFADIAYERTTMANELKSKILDIALRLNAKIFGDNSADHATFLRTHAKDITL